MKHTVEDARNQEDNMVPPEQIFISVENRILCYSVRTYYHGNILYSIPAGRFPIKSYAGINFYDSCLQMKLYYE